MRVKTDLKAGGMLNDAANQAKQAVSATTGYLMDTRQGVLNYAQSGLNKVREAVQTLATL
jgi:hypothetical protein